MHSCDEVGDSSTNLDSKRAIDDVMRLARQLRLDMGLLYHELYWALGEERINKITPTSQQFRTWQRQKDGLNRFWEFANNKLGSELDADDVQDVWECIDLTLNARKRRAFNFQDYLMLAMRSEQKCEVCNRQPPEVRLEIDHILPVSQGGSNIGFNLRFLCQHHNRSRGNRFRWADIWRRGEFKY